MTFVYQLLIFLFVLFYLPFFFFEYFKKGKYNGRLKSKLGLRKYVFRKGTPVIWVHAVSVGEIKGAANLLKELKTAYPKSTLIVSSITETGHLEAKKCTAFADHHILLPIDFKWTIKSMLKGLKLDLLLVVETDIWPNFVRQCKKQGAQVGLINGKVSKRSYSRLKKLPFFTKWYFSSFDFLQVQDHVYKERFVDLGIAEEKIQIVPNLKLDDIYPELELGEKQVLKKRFGIQDYCITLGSTHSPEEVELLEAIKPLLEIYPNLKILLVPRHPERISEVETILQKLNFTYGRYSQSQNFDDKTVILIDTMGFLRTCYELADVAIVAGSFTPKVGGHNILEPLWYTTPCLFGPYMHSQGQFLHLVQNAEAGFQIPVEEVSKKLSQLIEDVQLRKEMGERGKAIFKEAQGGTEKSLNFIRKRLDPNDAKV